MLTNDYHLQVFEAEKMNSKKGFYHKKCFSCIKCKAQTDYFNAIEGPDDEVKPYSIFKNFCVETFLPF